MAWEDLMFLAQGDAGLKRAVKLLYGEKAVFEKMGKKWKPFRSSRLLVFVEVPG